MPTVPSRMDLECSGKNLVIEDYPINKFIKFRLGLFYVTVAAVSLMWTFKLRNRGVYDPAFLLRTHLIAS